MKNVCFGCWIILDDTDVAAPIETVALPAGRNAVLTYKGAYSGLPTAYDQHFSVWLPTSGQDPADPPAFEGCT